MEEENRESVISIKSVSFKDEDVKFQIGLRMDFGKIQCTERMDKIRALGIEPSNNAISIVHEFESETAAENMVTKVNEFKAVAGPQIGKPMELLESIKAVGKKVVVSLRLPPEAVEPLSKLEDVSKSMGDFASRHQFLEFKIADCRNLNEIISDTTVSALSKALEAMCIKFTLSMNKLMPIKVAEFISTMAPGPAQAQVMLAGHAVAAFHHLKLEIELREPNEDMKQVLKNHILMGIIGGSQMLYGMGEQYGFMEVAKNGGAQTTAMLCLSPILSFEFTIFAPTAVQAIEKAASPEFAEKAMSGASPS